MTRHTPALSFLLLVAVAYGLWFALKPDPEGNALRTREFATRGLAEHLARTQPGKRALVISNPFTQRKGTARGILQMEEAGIRGLRKGFAGKVTMGEVVFPELKPGALENPRAQITDADTTTPLSYLVATDGFDKLARQHADCEILVSLIGLPAELNECEAWKSPGAPRFALLLPDLRVLGDTAAVQAAVKSGKLAAFVVRKPGAPDDGAPPGRDFKSEFEKRFVLVTAENVDQVLQTHPGLF
jgi:hypothetical protein